MAADKPRPLLQNSLEVTVNMFQYEASFHGNYRAAPCMMYVRHVRLRLSIGLFQYRFSKWSHSQTTFVLDPPKMELVTRKYKSSAFTYKMAITLRA